MLKPRGVMVIEEPDIRVFGVKLIALAEKIIVDAQSFPGAGSNFEIDRVWGKKDRSRGRRCLGDL